VINTATNTVVGSPIPVGSRPFGIAVAPNGSAVYVANNLGNSVSVIDTATKTVSATIPVGLAPQGLAITPNGQFVYVANFTSNTVSKISTVSNTVVTGHSHDHYNWTWQPFHHPRRKICLVQLRPSLRASWQHEYL